jgi:hypothetical protein
VRARRLRKGGGARPVQGAMRRLHSRHKQERGSFCRALAAGAHAYPGQDMQLQRTLVRQTDLPPPFSRIPLKIEGLIYLLFYDVVM